MKSRIERFDADKDGSLNATEFKAMQTNRFKHRQLDDSSLSKAEFLAKAPDFKTLDTNKDGKLSRVEIRKGHRTGVHGKNHE